MVVCCYEQTTLSLYGLKQPPFIFSHHGTREWFVGMVGGAWLDVAPLGSWTWDFRFLVQLGTSFSSCRLRLSASLMVSPHGLAPWSLSPSDRVARPPRREVGVPGMQKQRPPDLLQPQARTWDNTVPSFCRSTRVLGPAQF